MPIKDLLDVVHEATMAAGRRHQISDRAAREIALAVEEAIRLEHGGREVYVRAPDRAGRNAAIVAAAHGGMSKKEIAHRYGLSEATVHRIVKKGPRGSKLMGTSSGACR